MTTRLYPEAMFRPRWPRYGYVQLRRYRQSRFGDAGRQHRRFDAAGLFTRWAASPTFYRQVGLIGVGAGGFYIYNLEEVPVCGLCRADC
jgi:hypothetical protein